MRFLFLLLVCCSCARPTPSPMAEAVEGAMKVLPRFSLFSTENITVIYDCDDKKSKAVVPPETKKENLVGTEA